MPTRRHPWLALLATLLVQTLVAMAQSSAAVLAPAVAPQLGFAPERIGLYTAVGYLFAMVTGLFAGSAVARLGAMGLSQFAMLACAAAAALAAFGPAAAVLAVAACVGAGYGVVNPAAAAVLAQHAPQSARGVYFSIKQAGVPLGVGLAGLLMPLGLVALGWRAAVAILGVACLLCALVLVAGVRRLEPPRPAQPLPQEGAAQLLRRVWRTPILRAMCLASVAYAVSQQVFVTFLVSMLNLGLGWSLAAAAGVLALSQALSVAARIALGALGDRTGRPLSVLVGLGVAMAVSLLALAGVAAGDPVSGEGAAGLGSAAPTLLATLAALACAATAMGWNGVFFGALAEQVPQGELARVAGATQFFTFGGGLLGPLAFGEALRAGAGYAACYAAAAAVPLMAAWFLARTPAAGVTTVEPAR